MLHSGELWFQWECRAITQTSRDIYVWFPGRDSPLHCTTCRRESLYTLSGCSLSSAPTRVNSDLLSSKPVGYMAGDTSWTGCLSTSVRAVLNYFENLCVLNFLGSITNIVCFGPERFFDLIRIYRFPKIDLCYLSVCLVVKLYHYHYLLISS